MDNEVNSDSLRVSLTEAYNTISILERLLSQVKVELINVYAKVQEVESQLQDKE